MNIIQSLLFFYVKQGMDDQVVAPSMTDYISRVLPQAILHRLPDEGHFSYLFFCDGCHRQIFSVLFGRALGPIDKVVEADDISVEEERKEAPSTNGSTAA